MPEYVILVDEQDQPVGTAEKLRAHVEGWLHRALSVFVFNTDGALLLQQRHPAKYHSGGLWSNTCCSHPRPGEDVTAAAHRRLKEEMGFDCDLERVSHFFYKAKLDETLYEHECDHLFSGRFDGTPVPNAEEVADWRWVDVHALAEDLAAHPERYTFWLPLALQRVLTRPMP